MGFRVGDRVVKDPGRWRPSDFDGWGAGVGIGVVVDVLDEAPGETLGDLDVRWPSGRCYQRSDEVLPAPPLAGRG